MSLLTASGSNAIAKRINALWNLGGIGVDVHRAESSVVLDNAVTVGISDFPDSPNISGFIFLGTETVDDPGFDGFRLSRVRDWADPFFPVVTYVTPNTVGEWDDWSSSANVTDFVWRLELVLGFPFSIERIELYQVSPSGEGGAPYWGSGQAWATDNPVKPFASQPGASDSVDTNTLFAIFPMRVTYGGSLHGSGSTLNTDYASQLDAGPYTASAAHTFYLYGSIVKRVPATDFFRVLISVRNLDNGQLQSVMRGTIPSIQTDPATEL